MMTKQQSIVMMTFLPLWAVFMNFHNSQVLAFQTPTSNLLEKCAGGRISECHLRLHSKKQFDELSEQDSIQQGNGYSPPMPSSTRRQYLVGAAALMGGTLFGLPPSANAGIDVSGLKIEGGDGVLAGGSRVSNPNLASQLKSYDGSGSARVREIQSMPSSGTTTTTTTSSPTSPIAAKSAVEDRTPIATWAYRANPGMGANLNRAGPLGTLYRCNDQLMGPSGSKRYAINVQFEFPSDWLQLDRQSGGIQYVDQRNGDKLYLFRAPLPAAPQDGQDVGVSLANIPKSTIGDMIFDQRGSLVRSGQTVEEYKVTSAKIISECPNNMCATRRRFKIKYATVTGNGLRVERRALVDAYQVQDDIYMLMTSSNAVKFEQKDSRERETVETIVDSFQVDA